MNKEITKGAVNLHSAERNIFFYDSARKGMLDFLNNYQKNSNTKILIPGYIGWSPREGSGVFDPIAQSGINFGFYELNPDLTVNIESLGKLLEEESTSMVLLIDYFGFSDPNLIQIVNLVAQSNSILIRDLAHSLVGSFNQNAQPEEGHVRLFSLHKSLPLPTGGAVDYPAGHLVTNQQSSNFTVAEGLLAYNLETIASIRKANFQTMRDLLQDLPSFGRYFTFLRDPSPNDVPHTYPVLIESDCRDQLYEALNRDQIGVVSLYHTLIPEVPSKLVNVHTISKKILNLPVHQDLGRNEIIRVVESFERHLESISKQ